MEIKFNNRQELKRYLDYLEGVEIEGILKYDCINNYYGRENYMDLFLDKIFNQDYIDMFSFTDLDDNEKISKLLWGIWIEDEEKRLNELYKYDYNSYIIWFKFTQCFEECFTTNWEEERKEKEKLEKEYKRKLEKLEREYKKEIKELNKRYNK